MKKIIYIMITFYSLPSLQAMYTSSFRALSLHKPSHAPATKKQCIDDSLIEKLAQACQEGNINRVEQIIAQCGKVNLIYRPSYLCPCRNSYPKAGTEICNCHPLIIAAQNGFTDICKLLIAHGADVNIQDCFGHTALRQASWYCHREIVNVLLDAGAKIIKKEIGTDTPLTVEQLVLDQQLIRVILDRNWPAVDMFIAQGAHANPPYAHYEVVGDDNRHKTNCLCRPLNVAFKNNSPLICKMLIDAGADVNAPDCAGNTVLHEASWEGNRGLVSLLIAAHADVNITNAYGAPAINLAARGANGDWLEIVDILLRANAKLHYKSWARNESAFHWLASNTRNQHGTIHPLCDQFMQKLLEKPDKTQRKRLVAFLCCCKRMGSYRDIITLLKDHLLAIIVDENQKNPDSFARQEIDNVSNTLLKENLLKKYAKEPEKEPSFWEGFTSFFNDLW